MYNLLAYLFIFNEEDECITPPPLLMNLNFLHLGKLQGSAQPECKWISPILNNTFVILLSHLEGIYETLTGGIEDARKLKNIAVFFFNLIKSESQLQRYET